MDLFGHVLQGSPDILRGYKTVQIEIKDELFLAKGENPVQLTSVHTKDNNDFIEGTVFEITMEELIEADKYEPAGYERIQVTLESGKQAWFYINLFAS